MLYKLIKTKNLFKYFLKLLLCFSFSNFILANEVINDYQENKINLKYIDNLPNNEYLLGNGDTLEISISKDKYFDNLKTLDEVDINGTILLPKLNRIYVRGLTVSELKNILNERYKEFINFPDVEIKITNYRAISFYIDGEVKNPGLYKIDSINLNSANKINSIKTINSIQNINSRNATVFDAIRLSGGITKNAYLKKITLIRKNSISNGGGKIQTTLDFSNIFELEDLSQNIGLSDGDIIKIPKAEINDRKLIGKAIKSNLNSKTIQVVVSGKVELPGEKSISISSSLNDAILVAGGVQPLPGKVLLVRFGNDGQVEKRKLRFSPKAKSGSSRNPSLQDGDLIFVGKGTISHVTSILNQITSPLSPVVTSYGLYKALTE